MPDPCETRRHLEDADPVRDELRAVLSAWHEAFGHTLMMPFRRRQLPPERLRGPVYQPKIARFPAPAVHPRTPSAAPSLRNTIESPIRCTLPYNNRRRTGLTLPYGSFNPLSSVPASRS